MKVSKLKTYFNLVFSNRKLVLPENQVSLVQIQTKANICVEGPASPAPLINLALMSTLTVHFQWDGNRNSLQWKLSSA